VGESQVLAAQAGLISRQQALECGMTATTVTRRVSTKEWRAVFPGVYRHVAAVVDDRLMVHAAALWLGPCAVISGSWAAWWHDLRAQPDGPVSMTVPKSSSYRRHRHAWVRRRDLAVADVVSVRSLRVTSRPLTALENAALPDGQDVFDRALQRHVSVVQLEDSMQRMSGATGASAARKSIQLVRDGTVSPPERELAAAMRKLGLSQVKAGVRVSANGRSCWLAFAVEEVLLAIEVDGVSADTDPTVFHADRERQNALIMAGWTVLRYTPWQIRNKMPAIIAEIQQVILGRVGK
jgi:very-short-patch-repair endonuclease